MANKLAGCRIATRCSSPACLAAVAVSLGWYVAGTEHRHVLLGSFAEGLDVRSFGAVDHLPDPPALMTAPASRDTTIDAVM